MLAYILLIVITASSPLGLKLFPTKRSQNVISGIGVVPGVIVYNVKK